MFFTHGFLILHAGQKRYHSLFDTATVWITDLDKYSIQMPYHVATDNGPSKFRSIFSDNLKSIATRGKKARGTVFVDIGCSSKRAPLSVSYYNEISGGHIGSCRCLEEGLCRPSTAPVVWIACQQRSKKNVSMHRFALQLAMSVQCLAACHCRHQQSRTMNYPLSYNMRVADRPSLQQVLVAYTSCRR